MRTLIFFLFITCFLSAEEECEKVFNDIYNNAIWGINEDGLPGSGVGSFTTVAVPYIDFLSDFLRTHHIRTVVDLGCGDWCFSRHIPWGSIQYLGIDVVKALVERNQQLYGSPKIAFIHGDLLNMELPSADLLICKDVLQHLKNEDIKLFLNKIGCFKHCLFTNCIYNGFSVDDLAENIDISRRGEFRPLDLTKPPFNLKGTKIFTYPHPNGSVKQTLHVY